MAWTYADWASRQETATASGVDVSERQLSFSGDLVPSVSIGQRVGYSADTGGGNGSYIVESISYLPDTSTLTMTYAPTGAVGDGTLTLPVTAASKLKYLRLHIAEVTQAMTASVATDGVSISAGGLQPYLNELLAHEKRLNPANRGLVRGRVISHNYGSY